MKWLCITTLDTNPGDEFARMGVQRLIRDVDSEPKFLLVNKESPTINRPVEFDRAVICGMPLIWSFPWPESRSPARCVPWWQSLMRGWISRDPRKLCGIGLGDVRLPNAQGIYAPSFAADYASTLVEIESRTSFCTWRAPVGLPVSRVSCCPSAFAFYEHATTSSGPKVCNFMEAGGHFNHPEAEFGIWRSQELEFSNLLRDRGFWFVAHNRAEERLSARLGWPEQRLIRYENADQVAKVYQHASVFVGNRVHGAAVCAARRVPSLCITYDSRLCMAARLGATARRPSQITPAELTQWLNDPAAVKPEVSIRAEHEWTTNRLREFAS